jgi:hypothetical protein
LRNSTGAYLAGIVGSGGWPYWLLLQEF